MKGGNETAREIVAEMQREAAEYSQKSDSITCGVYSICITDYADRLDAALAREAAPAPKPQKFDEAAFDAAVSKPSGWDAVADPVAEIRRMRDGTPSSPEEVLEVLRAFHDAHYSVFPRDELTERLCHAYHDQFVADAPVGNAAKMRAALEVVGRMASSCLLDEGCGYAKTLDNCEAMSSLAHTALSAPPRNCDAMTADEAKRAWNEYRHSVPLPRGGWDFWHVINWMYAKAEGGAQ